MPMAPARCSLATRSETMALDTPSESAGGWLWGAEVRAVAVGRPFRERLVKAINRKQQPRHPRQMRDGKAPVHAGVYQPARDDHRLAANFVGEFAERQRAQRVDRVV